MGRYLLIIQRADGHTDLVSGNDLGFLRQQADANNMTEPVALQIRIVEIYRLTDAWVEGVRTF